MNVYYWITVFAMPVLIFSWSLLYFMFFSYNYLRITSFFYLLILLNFLMFLFLVFNKLICFYQTIMTFFSLFFFQMSYILAIDGLSILLLILVNFLLLFCFLAYWFMRYKMNLYSFCLFFSLLVLFNAFTSLDLILFYIFFEGIVIPMFLLIGIWGTSVSKIYAAFQLFLYTLAGSIFIILAFLFILLSKGSLSFDLFYQSTFFETKRLFLFIFLFLGFSVKMPTLPVHIWLPEAHVEAPTPGSVMLAGIMLKLGSYAMVSVLVCPSVFMSDLVFFVLVLALMGFFYSSLVALSQIDIKKMIAYSSMAHMNFSLIGLFSQSIIGLTGVFILMFGHAMTSGALFLGVGVLYDRYKTRLIFYYSGLVSFMPLLAVMYFFMGCLLMSSICFLHLICQSLKKLMKLWSMPFMFFVLHIFL